MTSADPSVPTTPPAPTAAEAEERDPETVAPGEEFDALVESMIGALYLHGWDAENAREWPFVSLPDYANGMANRLTRVEEENASLTAALLAARREAEAAHAALSTAEREREEMIARMEAAWDDGWKREPWKLSALQHFRNAIAAARAALAATQEER